MMLKKPVLSEKTITIPSALQSATMSSRVFILQMGEVSGSTMSALLLPPGCLLKA